ncbi:TrkA family potassium uptake protein [Planococcus sp. CP5-4]|uniref:potassium channel family protein n=1 Tax=unclassified Planococcus (in: firmicutes) TaxID=2662419 RepID=UPI001C20FE72|nr:MULTISPECIES: TrkA family potassium uptake protein [unclassified Planococcus (in: firmicutes)]MBU9675081.1 TrkA family potassium uptake protein [Planococcus sp. CP5-4_YE]MBV0910170.1 TrkA family potassium uptake protein [Planococcus sp. CP5-4_UN]MBW6064623.1 TrkA family potassium uptake protein [Planococcus sp. CP5-4]
MRWNKKQFAVIGLGRFGGSICKELHQMGHDVLAIDRDEKKVVEFAAFSSHALQLDSTNESALKRSGITNFENVIVAIGEDIQSSILTTLVLKDLQIPKVYVKAQNHYHQKVLMKIGVEQVVQPEIEMGKKMAEHLGSQKIIDSIDLSADYSITELMATPKVNRKSLNDLKIRLKFGVTVLAIKRGEELNVSPLPHDILQAGDVLTVLGTKKNIHQFDRAGL